MRVKMQQAGAKFWELLAGSVITSSLLASALMVTACSLWWRGMTVPSELYALLYGVVGFFFMSKTARNGRVG